MNSGLDDADIVLTPAPSSPAQVLQTRKVRAVRRVGPDGQPQVFLTTLPRSRFTRESICDLYRRRWQVAPFYRLEKRDSVGHHQFHAKYPEGVRQEVFAFLSFTAITRTLMAAAAKAVGAPYERISQKSAILATARTLTVLCLESENARETLAALLSRISARLDPKYRERACPRESFKPRSRWGPRGHVLANVGKGQLGLWHCLAATPRARTRPDAHSTNPSRSVERRSRGTCAWCGLMARTNDGDLLVPHAPEHGHRVPDKEPPTMLKRSAYTFLFAALLSLVLSIYLWFSGQREEGQFVGLWVPSILALGVLFGQGKGR